MAADVRRLLDELASVRPHDVTALTGAGLSVEGPCSLPTGAELTQRVFDAFFLPGTLERIRLLHGAVGLIDQPVCPDLPRSTEPRLPRLETVLGVAARVYGPRAIEDSIPDVARAEPNRLHRFFARHLALGGGHLTANFDRCVELAAGTATWPPENLLHFHGAAGGGDELGATLARIEKGFPPDTAAEFRTLLTSRPVVVIAGYSGSDFFDVNVAIEEMPPNALRGHRVVWLWHSTHRPHVVVPPSDASGLSLFDILRARGAELTVLCGPTDFLLRRLADQWGMPPLGSSAPRAPATPSIACDDTKRPEASFHLYLDVGLIGEVESMLPALAPALPADQFRAITSAVLWEAGRWNDVRRLWWRAPRRDSNRLERVGASLWVQGRFLPALCWLDWHRRRTGGPARTMLAETQGRVLEHMLRTPDLRWLARRIVPTVLAELGQAEQSSGVNLYRRHADLTTSLAAAAGASRPPNHALASSEWFGQAGNVLAWINYRHRICRDSYDDSIRVVELRRRYSELQQHYRAAGSASGVVRIHLLPGAHRVFTLGEVVAGVFCLQFGWWQRVRVVAYHVLQRVIR
ncbi:hypothetical protein [Nocardia araoensis]|uniref:hypothetical protein n=1 Tax=Nocardia araoensis TaxID=228600 RepID=UPI000311B177|nr:hypothetical protein [Nocardia araoensis]